MNFTPRIFLHEDLQLNKEIKILDKTYHYIKNVMRCSKGDSIILINGKDGEFLSNITFLNNKYIILTITKKTKDYKPQPFLGLIFSPIQKLDLLLKGATELGTTNFLPITTIHTNKSNIKQNKFEGNIIEAIEQSERLDLPKIEQIASIKTTLDKLCDNSIIFFCEERTSQNSPLEIYKNTRISNKNIYALVGPEGGFSDDEKQLIKSYKNVISISLGDTILRTETAAISILSIIKAFYFLK